MVYLLKIVIFHGYVSHNQLVTYSWELADQSQITREGFHEFHPKKITVCGFNLQPSKYP